VNKEARAYCLLQRKIATIEYAEMWGKRFEDVPHIPCIQGRVLPMEEAL
jgi:hypothetical protein